jgi:hypothetical protein
MKQQEEDESCCSCQPYAYISFSRHCCLVTTRCLFLRARLVCESIELWTWYCTWWPAVSRSRRRQSRLPAWLQRLRLDCLLSWFTRGWQTLLFAASSCVFLLNLHFRARHDYYIHCRTTTTRVCISIIGYEGVARSSAEGRSTVTTSTKIVPRAELTGQRRCSWRATLISAVSNGTHSVSYIQ